MEVPQQTLPRMEPGHVSDQKLPRVEGVGVHDDVAPSEYPKYIDHPVRGLTLAADADHEAMLREEIANLPPVPPPTQQELAKAELEKTLGRPLTDLECMVGAAQLLEFVTEKRMLVSVHPEYDGEIVPELPAEDAPVVETLAEQNKRIADEYGIDLSTLPEVPPAPPDAPASPAAEPEAKPVE